jgi:short-subunit dehydrogenase
MPSRFADKVVVISGATSGIGYALALAFQAEGATVVGLGRDQRRLGELGQHIDLALTCDVTKPRSVEVATQALRGRHGRVDVLVNCAGVGLFRSVEQTSEEELIRLLQVNLIGMQRLTRALLPDLRATQGRVVQIASIAGTRGMPNHAAYCASKFALIGWSDAFRAEETQLKVTVICPPGVDTPFFDNAGNPSFREDNPGVPLLSAEQVAAETVDACFRVERRRILGTRARALHAANQLAPGTLEALRRGLRGKD